MFLFDVVRKVIKRAKTNIGAERLHVLVWLSHSTSVCIGVQNCKQNDSAKRFYRTNITVTSMFEVRMVALRTIAFNHCQRSIYMPHEKYHDSRNKLESKNRCVHRSCYWYWNPDVKSLSKASHRSNEDWTKNPRTSRDLIDVAVTFFPSFSAKLFSITTSAREIIAMKSWRKRFVPIGQRYFALFRLINGN